MRKTSSPRRSTLQIRLYLIGALILILGLAGCAVIYRKATDARSDAIGYEFANGETYEIAASDSKRYRHDLERFGGKAAVMADDFNRWFTGLWQGKRLAYTLAVLVIGAALACFWAAHSLPDDPTDNHDD